MKPITLVEAWQKGLLDRHHTAHMTKEDDMGLDIYIGRKPTVQESLRRSQASVWGADRWIPETPVTSFSYGGFHAFRTLLAAAEGIDLEQMEGFSESLAAIPWDEVETPLKPLLAHSDCDGELSPQECAQVVDRLEAIVATMPRDNAFRSRGLVLGAAMRFCAEHHVPLLFL